MTRRINLSLFALAALLLAIYGLAGIPLRKARALWREGNAHEAAAVLEKWSRLRLRPAEYDQALAVTYLSDGRLVPARALLARATRYGKPPTGAFDSDEVARRLVASGRYPEFLLYDGAMRRRDDNITLYRAAALIGSGRTGDAASALAQLDEDDVAANELTAVKSALQQHRSGTLPLITDRKGRVIANLQTATRDVVAVNSDFAPLIEGSYGDATIEKNLAKIGDRDVIETTLDADVQHAAMFALGGFRGSLVAIDVASNEVIAIATNPIEGDRKNLAFDNKYEPGSVIKVLTTMAAVDAGVDLKKVFPLECPGVLTLEGRLFHDWAKHDQIADVNEALATSCNVSYAKLGMLAGGNAIDSILRKAGFGSRADLQLFDVDLGKAPGPLVGNYPVASAACGLVHETISPIHLAVIARTVASGGHYSVPTLVRSRKNILGDSIPVKVSPADEEIASQSAVATAVGAMRAVVTDPRGTGRRAAVDGLTIAMKTGTAGERADGYNALILAFAPAENPKIAIGLIAEHAGPAEFSGAKIVHDFLAQLHESGRL